MEGLSARRGTASSLELGMRKGGSDAAVDDYRVDLNLVAIGGMRTVYEDQRRVDCALN